MTAPPFGEGGLAGTFARYAERSWGSRTVEVTLSLDEIKQIAAALAENLDLQRRTADELSTVTVEYVASRGLSKVTSWVERSRGEEIARMAMEARR